MTGTAPLSVLRKAADLIQALKASHPVRRGECRPGSGEVLTDADWASYDALRATARELGTVIHRHERDVRALGRATVDFAMARGTDDWRAGRWFLNLAAQQAAVVRPGRLVPFLRID